MFTKIKVVTAASAKK